MTLSEAADVPAGPDIDLVALDDALKTLETLSPRQSRVVELRFFAGLEPGGDRARARRVGGNREA